MVLRAKTLPVWSTRSCARWQSAKLIAVNNRQFTPTILRDAVAKTASSDKPLELLIKTGDYYETHRLDYRGGERYPHLVRDSSSGDLLAEIIRPHAK